MHVVAWKPVLVTCLKAAAPWSCSTSGVYIVLPYLSNLLLFRKHTFKVMLIYILLRYIYGDGGVCAQVCKVDRIEVWVTGYCEPSHSSPGNQTWVCCKGSRSLNHWDISPTSSKLFIKISFSLGWCHFFQCFHLFLPSACGYLSFNTMPCNRFNWGSQTLNCSGSIAPRSIHSETQPQRREGFNDNFCHSPFGPSKMPHRHLGSQAPVS